MKTMEIEGWAALSIPGLSALCGIIITWFLIASPPRFSSENRPRIVDLQNDGSQYYGKPLITIAAIPFDVNTPTIFNQFQISIASWLRCSAQIIVHLYDVVDGMGKMAPDLIRSLQDEFGADRIMVKDKIVKKLKIETIPEAFEILERHAETKFCGWFSNDMILPPDWMDYVYATDRYFANHKNWSMHFPRRDLYESCRKFINLSIVAAPNWPEFLNDFRVRCKSRLHSLGYDCYLWNHIGINMTKAQVVPFYIGRPNFDGVIMKKQMDQGWFVTGFPECVTYHLEHPDRLQYAKRLRHPDSVYNSQLMQAAGGWAFGNANLDLRVSKNKMVYRINDVWYDIPLDRPDHVWPLTLPVPTVTPAPRK